MDQEKTKGIKPTDAEFEQRIQIVEALIVRGRAKTIEETQRGLALAGRPNLSRSVCHKYLTLARNRLAECTKELREQRKEMVFQSIIGTHALIKKGLKKHKVAPTWSDLLAVEKLMQEMYCQQDSDEPPVNESDIDTETEDEKENREKLNDAMRELLKNSKETVVEIVTRSVDQSAEG